MKKDFSSGLDPASSFLMSTHDAVPGITENVLNSGKSSDGRSSYEILADAAGLKPGMTVVDLACGSGPLLVLISSRIGPSGHAVGIDLNGSELALAEKRLGSRGNVEFRRESADALSLSDSSTDAVLCHMALMLFQPLDSVLLEIARILRPSGILSCVLPSLNGGNALFSEIRETLSGIVGKDVSAEKRIALGNRETGSVPLLKEILKKTGKFGDSLQIVDFEVIFRDTPESLARRFLPFFYYTALLSVAGKEELLKNWTSLFKNSMDGKSGLAEFRLPLSVFTIHKAK